jgi:hypothetical protein
VSDGWGKICGSSPNLRLASNLGIGIKFTLATHVSTVKAGSRQSQEKMSESANFHHKTAN